MNFYVKYNTWNIWLGYTIFGFYELNFLITVINSYIYKLITWTWNANWFWYTIFWKRKHKQITTTNIQYRAMERIRNKAQLFQAVSSVQREDLSREGQSVQAWDYTHIHFTFSLSTWQITKLYPLITGVTLSSQVRLKINWIWLIGILLHVQDYKSGAKSINSTAEFLIGCNLC